MCSPSAMHAHVLVLFAFLLRDHHICALSSEQSQQLVSLPLHTDWKPC